MFGHVLRVSTTNFVSSAGFHNKSYYTWLFEVQIFNSIDFKNIICRLLFLWSVTFPALQPSVRRNFHQSFALSGDLVYFKLQLSMAAGCRKSNICSCERTWGPDKSILHSSWLSIYKPLYEPQGSVSSQLGGGSASKPPQSSQLIHLHLWVWRQYKYTAPHTFMCLCVPTYVNAYMYDISSRFMYSTHRGHFQLLI